MPPVELRQPSGYAVSTFTGLVRAVQSIYAAVALAEGIAAPTIRAGRRWASPGGIIDGGPNTIVLVPRQGPWAGVEQMGHGEVASVQVVVKAHIWGPEPTIGGDELENELLRWDAADPLLDRFLNVLNRVAPGRIEPLDVDPDAAQGEAGAGAVNEHGETYVVSFRFLRPVARQRVVFDVRPTTDPTTGQPSPRPPAPVSGETGATISTVAVTTTPTAE
jgi:hypothetical protein